MSAIEKDEIAFGQFDAVDLRAARVTSAALATEARFPSRILELELGQLGNLTSVGQFALVDEDDLVGTMVVACVNLGSRKMGPYLSEALVLGTPHPDSPPGQGQALPLRASRQAAPGDVVF